MKPSNRIFCIEDARTLARRRQPKIIFDYVDGAAGHEQANHRNRQSIDEILLQPRALVNIEHRSVSTNFLNKTWDVPFGIAPMGMCNLSWPNADRSFGTMARDNNLPVALSTMGSTSIEDMHHFAGDSAWFQLYVGGDQSSAMDLVARAKTSGYDTLLLTVDVPEVAIRIRDQRNGFKVPFTIGPRQFVDFALHPRWSLTTLFHGAPETVNTVSDSSATFNRYAGRGAIDWGFLSSLRDQWPHKLLVKGITSVEDAVKAKQSGCDGVYLSNHGGRQLASAPAAIDLIKPVREAVGSEYPMAVDSGFRCGEDIVKAYALGADFVMLGRPFLWGVGADSTDGVTRVMDILRSEILNCMAQIGVNSISEIDQSHLVK